MRLQQLVYFKEVADRGSINKAAETLFMSQPNLSRAISTLEDELGTPLFQRHHKGVFLTDTGKQLYFHANSILGQMAIIDRMVAGKTKRVLTVVSFPGLISTRFMVKVYENFHEQGMVMELNMTEARISEIVDRVAGLRSELGIIQMNQLQKRDVLNYVTGHNLEFHELIKDTWYVFVGPKNPLFNRKEVAMQELVQYTLIRSPDDFFSNLTAEMVIDGVPLQKTMNNVLFLNNECTMLNMLKNTDIICFAQGINREDYENQGLHCIPIRNCNVETTIGWVKLQRDSLSPEGKKFVELLERYYAE